MPLVPADLIQPAGRIEPDLFSPNDPAGTTTERVTAWLEEAEDKTGDVDADDQEAAQSAWVYYRAFDSIATRYASLPSTLTPTGESIRPYTAQQIAEFRRLANQYRDEFNLYVEVDEGADASNSQLRTRVLRNVAAF